MHQLDGMLPRHRNDVGERLLSKPRGHRQTPDVDIRAAEFVLDSVPVRRRLAEASDGLGLGDNGPALLRAYGVLSAVLIVAIVSIASLFAWALHSFVPVSFVIVAGISWLRILWHAVPGRVAEIRRLHRSTR